jgi:hypothetical protein
MAKTIFILLILLTLTACGVSPTQPSQAVLTTQAPVSTETVPSATAESSLAQKPALKVSGKVNNEMAWQESEVKAMDTIQVQSKNNQGQVSDYTGVLLNNLLDKAGLQSDATTLIFVGDDGYTAEAKLADIQACTNCIVSFRSKGGFSTVLPDFPGNMQVKGVFEIQVK